MLFPSLQKEKIVQVDDKTRLDATESFASKDETAITNVEIDPGDGAGFISVFGSGKSKEWFLDYSYATDGDKTVQVRVTNAGGDETKSSTLTIINEVDDKLFSNDADLTSHEPDILNWIRSGRSTYKDVHRRAQELIFSWLDKKGYTDTDNKPLTKAAVIDIEEVRQWSTFMALRLIFEGNSNEVDDVQSEKAKKYKGLEVESRNRFILRLDLDGDGDTETFEGVGISSASLVRR